MHSSVHLLWLEIIINILCPIWWRNRLFFRLGACRPNPLGGTRGHPGAPSKTTTQRPILNNSQGSLLRLIRLKSTLNHSLMNIKARGSKYGQYFLRSSFGGSLGLGLWCLRPPKRLSVHAPKRRKSIPPPNGIMILHVTPK